MKIFGFVKNLFFVGLTILYNVGMKINADVNAKN